MDDTPKRISLDISEVEDGFIIASHFEGKRTEYVAKDIESLLKKVGEIYNLIHK